MTYDRTTDAQWQQPRWSEPVDGPSDPPAPSGPPAATDGPAAPGRAPEPGAPVWPTRDWSLDAYGRPSNGVTPGLTAASQRARSQGAWPGPPPPDTVAAPAPKQKVATGWIVLPVVMTALGLGNLAAVLALGLPPVAMFPVVGLIASGRLASYHPRKLQPAYRAWWGFGVAALVVNLVLTIVLALL